MEKRIAVIGNISEVTQYSIQSLLESRDFAGAFHPDFDEFYKKLTLYSRDLYIGLIAMADMAVSPIPYFALINLQISQRNHGITELESLSIQPGLKDHDQYVLVDKYIHSLENNT